MQLNRFILISLVVLMSQCSQHSSQVTNNQVANNQVANNAVAPPQQASPSPTDSQQKACDFSSFKPFKVGLMQAPAISMPRPVYPPEAKEQKIEGKVIVKLLINVHSGEVEKACIVEGSRILAKAAKDAALQIKFAPDWGNNKYLSERYKYLEAETTYNFVAQ